MSLTHEQKVFWLEGALSIYGSKLVTRLKACYPLYGLIWCLILLNDFRSDVWQRRALANDAKDEIKLEILSRQLGRARDLLENIAVGHGGLLAETYH